MSLIDARCRFALSKYLSKRFVDCRKCYAVYTSAMSFSHPKFLSLTPARAQAVGRIFAFLSIGG
jgi:hypothetical protein